MKKKFKRKTVNLCSYSKLEAYLTSVKFRNSDLPNNMHVTLL